MTAHSDDQPRKVIIRVTDAETGITCEWCDCTDTRRFSDQPCQGECTRDAVVAICDTGTGDTFTVCDYHEADCLRFIRKARSGAFHDLPAVVAAAQRLAEALDD